MPILNSKGIEIEVKKFTEVQKLSYGRTGICPGLPKSHSS